MIKGAQATNTHEFEYETDFRFQGYISLSYNLKNGLEVEK